MGPSPSKTPPPREETPPPTPKEEPLLKKPWRTHNILSNGWTEKVQMDLLDDISTKLKDKNINVAFIGPTASGKSSLINSYSTIVANQISCRTEAGSDITSFTVHFKQIKLENQLENISFYDTMGIEEGQSKGLPAIHAKAIAKGEIEPGKRLDGDIDDKVDKVKIMELFQHCLVYVLDGENVQHELKEDLVKKIGEVKHQLKDIPSGPISVVIVTHIDSLCPEVNDDITKVFDSAEVDKVIKRASTITGVPAGYIFPVKNYVTEQDVNTQMNILLLLAMQRIVNFSIDVIKGRMRDNYTANGTKTMD